MGFQFFISSLIPILILLVVLMIIGFSLLSKKFRKWLLDDMFGTRPLILFGTPYLLIEVFKLFQTTSRVMSDTISELEDDLEYGELGFLGFEGLIYHNTIWLALAILYYGWGLNRKIQPENIVEYLITPEEDVTVGLDQSVINKDV